MTTDREMLVLLYGAAKAEFERHGSDNRKTGCDAVLKRVEEHLFPPIVVTEQVVIEPMPERHVPEPVPSPHSEAYSVPRPSRKGPHG